MAVPTITSVSPSTGPASGYREVEIVGTGFAVPSFTPAVPGESRIPTVAVAFNGVSALRVWAASSTLLRVVIPPYTGSPIAASHTAVSVMVTNLDTDGVAVPGETVTRASAFTYERWEFLPPIDDCPQLVVLSTFLSRLMREVLTSAGMATHVDFSDEDSGGEYIAIASVPYVGIRVDFPRDVEYSQWDQGFEEVTRGDGDIDLYRGLRTAMMVVSFTVAGGGIREAMNLCGALEDMVILNPYVDVPAGDLYSGETNRHPIDITSGPRQVKGANKDGIMIFSMGMRVRGIRSMVGVPVERIKTVASASIIFTNMDAENQVTWNVF